MKDGNDIYVIKARDVLIVTMPPDPEDSTVTALQERVLGAMDRHLPRGVILDLSLVETLDSFFARTVSDTAEMVTLMGGRTIVVGMQPAVAVTATQMGLTLNNIETALTVDQALDRYAAQPAGRKVRT
jgi:rsbT antagonist protein RsbS